MSSAVQAPELEPSGHLNQPLSGYGRGRRLTLRSTRAPTATHVRPGWARILIVPAGPYVLRCRARVSSNVRPHKRSSGNCSAMPAPTAFISYSHDSQEHKRWVLEFATRLRSNGVDATLDQWELGPGSDLPHFMEQAIVNASRILMVCTARYVEKANRGTGGVGYEKMIVTADLLQRIGSNRVIPIVRQSGTVQLPTFLASKLYIDLSTPDQFETGFDQLLRDLLGAPLFRKPPLAAAPQLTDDVSPRATQPDPVTQFMLALSAIYQGSSSSGGVDTERVYRAMGTSKLLFDHAFDIALDRKLVSSHGTKTHLWVTAAGRALLIQLSAQSSGAA
jgi:TIR domain